MKKIAKILGAVAFTAAMFVSCGGKTPVAGKKMVLTEKIAGSTVEFTYVFSDTQYWLDGAEGMKGKYEYNKETDTLILDGGKEVPMSSLKQVK